MSLIVILILAAALAVALQRLWAHRRAARELQAALAERQPVPPGRAATDWGKLRAAANALLAELGELRRQRTGHLIQLEAMFGSLQEAVLIVDANNRVQFANRALQAIFPRAPNILHERLELALHSVAFLGYAEAVRAATARPQQEIEFIEAGASTWVETTGTLIPAGADGPWALFVLHDITRQKKLEAVRREFVANVSHELRTPLSVIKGCAETLVDGHRDMPVADRERFLRTIERHGERLNSLVEDLLALSRLESANPGLRREPAQLAGVLNPLVDDCRRRIAASGHELSVVLDPEIGPLFIDAAKITQVFENLIGNALKYTPRGARVEVTARRADDATVELCVRDNGPGIPAEDLPHIFERFYRVDKGRSRETGGTGLGLSIAKHIVQQHGGRVWVESEPGQGSAFFFTLPAHAGATAGQGGGARPSG